MRPGHYSGLSSIIQPTPSIPCIAGNLMVFEVILKDSRNNNITASTSVRPDFFSIDISGLITVNGVTFPAKFPGSVIQPDPSMPHLLLAQVQSNFEGEFTVSIMDSGDAVPSNLVGSPFTIVVNAAETNPSSCISSHPSVVIAGEDFNIVVQTFDVYNNPTDYESDDEFLGRIFQI